MAYILSSWTRATHSHAQSALFLSKQGPETPFGLYKGLFDAWQRRLMSRSVVSVACDDDDPSVILGYCIHEQRSDAPRILHYIQVKRELMRKGVATALLDTAGIDRESACIYTATSPIQGKVKTPQH